MTTMTSSYQRPEFGTIRINEGVEQIFEECGRCGGTGYVVFHHVDGGTCFDCRATFRGQLIGRGGYWTDKAKHDQRAKRRAADQARAERKAAEQAAALPGKLTASLQATPILADLLKLEDHSGFLGSLRTQLENKGELSPKQIATASRILLQNAERAAHIENERRNRVEGPIGEIGERREFTGKVVWFDHFQNQFVRYECYTTTMIIATPEGAIKWKASKQIPLEPGQQITINATVKSHDVDKQDRIITVVTKGSVVNS